MKGFLAPFAMSFMIALFVLVMQTLWLYVDDILGKGIGLLVIMEFIAYLSVSLFCPLALPIGILLAGVFQFGNLSEKYELSSIKSAGVPLIRTMLPAIIFGTLVGLFSFFCSDKIIPLSNLKFMSRLHDIRKQKPALALEEGVFNYDFYGYVIRIGDKAANGRDVSDVLIYDQSQSDVNGELSTIKADHGVMYTTESGRHFIMELYEGEFFQVKSRGSRTGKFPLVRMQFDTFQKVFDLTEFELNRSDEEIFKRDRRMKNAAQLRLDLDSIGMRLDESIHPALRIRSSSSVSENKLLSDRLRRGEKDGSRTRILDSIYRKKADIDMDKILTAKASPMSYQRAHESLTRSRNLSSSYYDERRHMLEQQASYAYELYLKYSLAFVCLLFIFVGVPLGAIIQKGGYGYPLIISISVFVAFILGTTFCKKLSDSLTVSASLAAFIPALILLPVGIFLTYWAMQDRKF